MSAPVRVLVVDDSAFVRNATTRMLEEDREIAVVGHATTGREAIDQVKALRPDVVIMDINMPEMDGLQALERIMATDPTPVILFSTLARKSAELSLRALELGAVDCIDKGSVGPLLNLYELGPALRERVLAVAQVDPDRLRPSATVDAGSRGSRAPATSAPAPARCPVVAIGASTGGPRALTELLGSLPGDFPGSVIVAQHMPDGFTGPLADRLDRNCALPVREAGDGTPLEPGSILVIPGRRDAWVQPAAREKGLDLRVSDIIGDRANHPSVDRLFRSLAKHAPERTVAVVLTGMGEDGSAGASALRRAGATILVESEQSAVIYGMPRAAASAAHEILPLGRIGPTVTRLVREGEQSRSPLPGGSI